MAGIFALIFFFRDDISCSQIRNIKSQGKNIICFGDSLTEGLGAEAGYDYPNVMARWLSFPVLNKGLSGDTTRGALIRLEKDVLSQDPWLVIIEFGANDPGSHISLNETLDNLKKIISEIQNRTGACVLLLEVRFDIFSGRFQKGLRRLARQTGCRVVPHLLKGILTNPHEHSDLLHPNDSGYQKIAQKVYEAVQALISCREEKK